jgi:hypothetical protein
MQPPLHANRQIVRVDRVLPAPISALFLGETAVAVQLLAQKIDRAIAASGPKNRRDRLRDGVKQEFVFWRDRRRRFLRRSPALQQEGHKACDKSDYTYQQICGTSVKHYGF